MGRVGFGEPQGAPRMGAEPGHIALHRLYDKLGVSNRTELALLVRDSES